MADQAWQWRRRTSMSPTPPSTESIGCGSTRWLSVPFEPQELPLTGVGEGQGNFGTCAVHAMLNTVIQQLKHRYGIELDFNENIGQFETLAQAHLGSSFEGLAACLSRDMKGHKALGRRSDAKKFELQLKLERRSSFEELLRVVDNSRNWVGDHGCGTCVVAISTSVAGHADHGVAAHSVEQEMVKCVNSWKDQPILICNRSNFQYFDIVTVRLENILISNLRTRSFERADIPPDQHKHSMLAIDLLKLTRDEVLRQKEALLEQEKVELNLRYGTIDKKTHQSKLQEVHKQYEQEKIEWQCLKRQVIDDLDYFKSENLRLSEELARAYSRLAALEHNQPSGPYVVTPKPQPQAKVSFSVFFDSALQLQLRLPHSFLV
jgi:hypothetical protein